MNHISNNEKPIMKALWTTSPLYFKDIYALFDGKLAKQTVTTMMFRLKQKGFLRTEGVVGKQLYYPVISREEYTWQFIHDIYEGMTDGDILDILDRWEPEGEQESL